MIKAILAGIFCFLLFLATHAVVFRAFRLKERFRALAAIFFSIIPLYALIYLLMPRSYLVVVPAKPANPVISLETVNLLHTALNFSSGLMLYVFLFLGYCQFYFIVDRSISVRVMIEIDRSPDKRLTFEEIMNVYSFNAVLSRRLEHMLEGNYLTKDNGLYSNTKKGRAEARVFSFLKGFLRLGDGG